MRSLNNKGFAFSTILYGLMIMGFMIIILIMSTMQTNRATNKYFIENIEGELNRYSFTDTEFAPNGDYSAQEFIVPEGQGGIYKIELWGAKGDKDGNYTSALVSLPENSAIYFKIGSTKTGQEKKTLVMYESTDESDTFLTTKIAPEWPLASLLPNKDLPSGHERNLKYQLSSVEVNSSDGKAIIQKIDIQPLLNMLGTSFENFSDLEPASSGVYFDFGNAMNITYYLSIGRSGADYGNYLTRSGGEDVKLTKLNAMSNQKWLITKNSDGTYRIAAQDSQYVLQLHNHETYDGSPVVAGKFEGSIKDDVNFPWEKWTVVSEDYGGYIGGYKICSFMDQNFCLSQEKEGEFIKLVVKNKNVASNREQQQISFTLASY